MATIASLSISLSAKVGKFSKGMAKARKDLRKFAKNIPLANLQVGKFAAGLVAAGGAGLAFLAKKQLVAIDQTTKFADRLGIATDKMVGLQLAGDLTGNRIETLQMGLQRMTRRVAEAAKGTGEAKDAIKELGLDALKLNAMAPDEQFKAIADSMEKVGNQSDRVRLSMKLFDSEGVALVNTMRGGSAALNKIQKDAERLGLTFSRVEAKNVERFNDSIVRLKAQTAGIGRIIAVKVAPFLEVMANRMIEVGGSSEEMRSIVDTSFEFIMQAIAETANVLRGFKAGWLGLKGVIALGTGTILNAFTSIGKGLESLVNLLPGVNVEFLTFADDFAEAMKDVGSEALAASKKEFEAVARGDTRKKVQGFFETLRKDMKERNKEFAADIAAREKQLEELGKTQMSVRKAGTGPGGKPGEFKVINLQRIGIPKFGQKMFRRQQVKDDQLKKTNTLLESIDRKVGRATPALTSA